MPFDRPSLADLERRHAADIDGELTALEPRLRRSLIGTIARVLTGAAHGLYGYIAWAVRQLFADSADGPELLRHANAYGITPSAAIQATGTLAITGTTGTRVDAGTKWRRGDDVEYESTADVVLAAGVASPAVRAVVAGAAGNAETGTKASLVSPIAGVVSDATADGALEGGHDEESVDSVRGRYLERLREPPQSGTVADYARWAKAAHAAVTRRWVRPLGRGLGTVDVYLMTDEATDDGVPAAAVATAARTYIDSRRPATADVNVIAPTAVEFNVTIDMLVPDTAAVRAAVESELADLILRDSEPGGTILLTHVREAISSSLGETDHDLVTPDADVTHADAEIAVLGTVTWQ